MPISRRILADDEEVVVDLRLHWIFLSGPVVLTAVAVAVAVAVTLEFPGAPVAVAGVLAAMVLVPGMWLAGRIVRWLSISLVVTTTRIVFRRGVLGRDLVQLRLQRVAEVHTSQTVLDRVIGSGRLVIELLGDQPLVVDDVPRPKALQRVITRELDELGHGAWPAAAAQGGDVPQAPVVAAGPAALEATPPRGTPAQPRWGTPAQDPWPPPAAPSGAAGHPTDPGSGAGRAGGAPTGVDGVPPLPAPPVAPTPAPSIPEQLIQLDDLRRRGIVSDAEFEAKKAELLSRL